MPAKIEIIGDEIRLQGELVALLVPEPYSHTAVEDFREALSCERTSLDELDVVLEKAKVKARGGLIRLADLTTIVDQIKKEESP